MAAEPEVRKVIQFHAVLRGNGRSGSSRGGNFNRGMTDRAGVRFGYFARPLAIRERDGDIAACRVEGNFGIGHALPCAAVHFNAVIAAAEVVSDRERVVGIDIDMAAEPEVRKVVQFHAVFRRNRRSGGRIDGRFLGRRLGGLCRFSRFNGFRRFGSGAFLLHRRRLDETEPDEQSADRKDHDGRDDAEPCGFLALARDQLQNQDHNDRQDDRIKQGDERVPVRRVVGFDLHGGGVRLRIQDVVARCAHCIAGRVVVRFDACAHQTEHHIVARADSQVRVHPGGVRHRRVGDNHAGKAPFAAQHIGDQRLRCARPRRAEIAVTRHDRGRAAFLDGQFKRLEVDFADRLFICPDGKTQAVAFLIVECEVLGIQIDALALSAFDLRRAELAGQEAVFGIVFKVTTGKRCSVDVHAGRIQTDDTVGRCFLRKDLAEFFHQFCIPRRADHDLARERNAAETADERVDAGRTVEVGGRRFSDARHRGRGPTAVQNHRRHVLVGQLLQKQFPLRIVPVKARHVLKHQTVVGIDDIGIGCVDLVGRLFTERFHDCVGSGLAVLTRFRGCACPVGTGDVNSDLSVLHIRKMCDGGCLVRQTRIAFAVYDCFCDRVRPAVDFVVCVVHQLDFVVACFENIAACTECIERRHILGGERNRHNLGFAWLQQLRLGKAREHNVRLFNSALRVRRSVIDLYDVLAADAAGVRDLHLHRDRAACAGKGFDALFKRRIGKPVTERILNSRSVFNVTVRSSGFVVPIADVDAFRILDVVAVEIAIGEASRIPVGRGACQIVCTGIDQSAGRIDRTAQHGTYRIETDRAGASDPQHRIDPVFDKAKLHRVGGIDQNDRLCKALCLDERDQIFFVLCQFEIVPSIVHGGVAGRVHILRKVAALAADP